MKCQLANNMLTCWIFGEGALAFPGVGCDFCIYIGQYNQRNLSLQTIYSPQVSTWTGLISFCKSISDKKGNQVSALQTIYSPAGFAWRGPSPLARRCMTSVTISDNIINEVSAFKQYTHSWGPLEAWWG